MIELIMYVLIAPLPAYTLPLLPPKEILTSTAFLPPQMMRLPSAVQVLHLTGTSSSPSVNRLLTSIDFHSLADATWKS